MYDEFVLEMLSIGEKICNNLEIGKMGYGVQEVECFPTPTMLAAWTIGTDYILFNKNYVNLGNEALMIFALAHELRHVWQYKKGIFRPDKYKRRNEVSLQKYNLQQQEIDANAYALFFVDMYFCTENPQGIDSFVFYNKNAEEIKLLTKRYEKIAKSGYMEKYVYEKFRDM